MKSITNKIQGCYIGGAIGDAMGGPVEGMHYEYIQQLTGGVKGFIEYKEPYRLAHPGGAVASKPGSITDDHQGRMVMAQAVLDKKGRINADDAAEAYYKYMKPWEWWYPSTLPFYKINRFNMAPRDAGLHHTQEGGNAYYTAVSIINMCDPEQAYWDVFDISSIWKRDIARELVSTLYAAIAHAFCIDATYQSVVQTALDFSTDRAKKYIDRAVNVAAGCKDWQEFIPKAYETLLHDDEPYFAQTPPDTGDLNQWSTSVDFREQIPLMFGVFYVAKGGPTETTLGTINLGRDCDSIGTTASSMAGALCGINAFPKDWVETVLEANPDPDMIDVCAKLEELVYLQIKQQEDISNRRKLLT